MVTLLGLGLVGSVVAASIYGLVTANRPVEGTIVYPQKPSKDAVADPNKMLSTAYYQLMYPPQYQLLPAVANSASLDARALVNRGDSGFSATSRLTVTVTNIPVGGVIEDSSYKLFASQPDTYTLETRVYGADTAWLKIKNQILSAR